MTEPHAYLKPLTDLLRAESRMRVWSVAITIFGDAAQPRGGRIAMSALQDLATHMGIEGNALRTAMSRLAKEGWVTRDKHGRHSFYSLSPEGKEAFIPATERIYQTFPPAKQGHWAIAVPPPGQKPVLGGLALKGAALFTQINGQKLDELRRLDNLVVCGNVAPIPDWVNDIAIPADLTERYQTLFETMRACERISRYGLTPLDAITARCLIIHHWRRIVLRHPPLPAELIPNNWIGGACATLVAQAYRELVGLSEAWWVEETSAAGFDELRGRFP